MKTRHFLLVLALVSTQQGFAQIRLSTDQAFENALIQSGLVHSPLPIDESSSFEMAGLQKEVFYTQDLPFTSQLTGWTHSGLGALTYNTRHVVNESQPGSMQLTFPTFTGKRATGSPSDPDYATYGHIQVSCAAAGADWSAYNRIVMYIYPDCEGARVTNLNFFLENGDGSTMEGEPSASHLINLRNREWNLRYLDLDEFQRDRIQRYGFSCSVKGRDRTTGETSVYYIGKMELQQVAHPEIVRGWMPGTNRIVYSTTGYMPGDAKTAIAHLDSSNKAEKFRLIDYRSGKTVFTAPIRRENTTIGAFHVLDFSAFNKPGEYCLQVGALQTPPFRIEETLWENSLWRTLNFIFCQRCGYPVPGKHGTCHTDLCARHDGKTILYGGGWHDAGDLSQQTLQTGDVTFSLLEAATKLRFTSPLLAARLLEEAEWGLEFVLRSRFGDGYRASSVGLLIWLDGVFGTLDDISTVRVHNLAFDNFLYAAYEAYAAFTIDHDPMLQEHLRRIARDDFAFALKHHEEVGYGGFLHFYEHSYNTSESQYMATISWAASMLYRLTGEAYYAEKAAEFICYTLDCQRTEPLDDAAGTRGFFYRDRSRKSIVHYNHQSREQVYMQALTLLCETQPNHPDYARWSTSIQLYGTYLKGLMKYTAPYGMIPAGVYHIDEAQDSVAFQHSHLFVGPEIREAYPVQLKKGVQLDNEHYLKRFPVWFSIFNGNTAVHLSTGKAAALCGKFLNDEELMRIAREQLYWTVGKNPFGQSLIYGEGHNYPRMDSFSSGEMTGEMPVGIRTWGNEDIPYWPRTVNATYKEVWVTSAGKWISLVEAVLP